VDAAIGTYEGTLHLRDGNRTLPKPLKITLSLLQPSSNVIPEGLAQPSSDQVVPDPGEPRALVVKDELLIKFANGTPVEQFAEIVETIGGVFVGHSDLIGVYQVRVVNGLSVDEAMAVLGADPRVEFAIPRLLHSANAIPDDPQWTEPSNDYLRWGQKRIRLDEAWGTTTGSSDVKIGIVDTGLDLFHIDLLDDERGTSFSTPTGCILGQDDPGFSTFCTVLPEDRNLFNTYIESPLEHGTAVAGVLGAVDSNNEGMAGVLWDADILFYPSASKASCLPNPQNPEDVACDILPEVAAEQMQRAIDAGARVINYSAGGLRATPDDALRDAEPIMSVIMNSRNRNQDVLFVFAAGNDDENLRRYAPANLVNEFPDRVIAVAASDSDNRLAIDFSESSPGSNWGAGITVAAPGKDIYTTYFKDPISSNSGYANFSGTSAAAPFVTGLAGLLLAAEPSLSAAELKDFIVRGAESDDTQNGTIPIADREGGFFYVIDAAESLRLATASRSGFVQMKLRGIVDRISTRNAVVPGAIAVGDSFGSSPMMLDKSQTQ
jgi:subtilisin family serine protease